MKKLYAIKFKNGSYHKDNSDKLVYFTNKKDILFYMKHNHYEGTVVPFDFNGDKCLKISDLEAKLAESESELEKQKEKYDKLYGCYKKTSSEDLQDKYRLAEENTQLKQQLAEKEKEKEKEKEIEELKAQRRIYSNRSVEECNKITDLEFELQHKYQDKIEFAVEKLEKVKELAHNHIKEISNDLSEEDDERLNQKHTIHGLATAITDIDNQIKQLKEGK